MHAVFFSHAGSCLKKLVGSAVNNGDGTIATSIWIRMTQVLGKQSKSFTSNRRCPGRLGRVMLECWTSTLFEAGKSLAVRNWPGRRTLNGHDENVRIEMVCRRTRGFD